MLSDSLADVALRATLAALAVYHLAIGVLSVVSLGTTSRVVSSLYGVALGGGGQLRHAVRMLGLQAIALGALAAVAAGAPAEHRAIVVGLALLQGMRALGRIRWRTELRRDFAVPPRRNAANAAILLAQVAILLGCLPPRP